MRRATVNLSPAASKVRAKFGFRLRSVRRMDCMKSAIGWKRMSKSNRNFSLCFDLEPVIAWQRLSVGLDKFCARNKKRRLERVESVLFFPEIMFRRLDECVFCAVSGRF